MTETVASPVAGLAAQTEPPITLTPQAAERLKEEMGRRGGTARALRLMVLPGGCAGLQYAMSFAKGDPDASETILSSHGVSVYVDARMVELLNGAKIAWVDNLIGGGFRVENPNAHHSCGCGKSFG